MKTNPFARVLDKQISISIRAVILSAISVFLLFYLVWEIYWLNRTGMIKWHVHIMLYVYLLVLGYILFRLLGTKWNTVKNIFFSVWLGLFFLEMVLMAWGGYETYQESIGQVYASPYKPSSSYYHSGYKELVLTRDEFTFTYPLNSFGFPDKEWNVSFPQGSQKKIIAFGDSFTFGDGAPYGESYVSRLSALLNKNSVDSNYYVMNAGFCGSDPFFNYVNLRDRFLPSRPDLVIQSVSSQDLLHDYAVRGGMERFLPNEELKFKSAPWWEMFFGASHIVRVFVKMSGYNDLLIKENDLDEKKMMDDLLLLFTDYVSLCNDKGITLVVVFRPEKGELISDKYEIDFSPLKMFLSQQKGVYIYDVAPYFKQQASNTGKEVNDYYWKKDGHHNSDGYAVMAEGIYGFVKPILDSLPNRAQK